MARAPPCDSRFQPGRAVWSSLTAACPASSCWGSPTGWQTAGKPGHPGRSYRPEAEEAPGGGGVGVSAPGGDGGAGREAEGRPKPVCKPSEKEISVQVTKRCGVCHSAAPWETMCLWETDEDPTPRPVSHSHVPHLFLTVSPRGGQGQRQVRRDWAQLAYVTCLRRQATVPARSVGRHT